VLITATDRSDPTLVDSATVEFVQKRVVVLVQGVTTHLSETNDQDIFPLLRNRLAAAGFVRASRGTPEVRSECADQFDSDNDQIPNDGCALILNFSYAGGGIGPGGVWVPTPYECRDTANDLASSVGLLRLLLLNISSENPNTRFVIVGHSQGGFLALQSLRWASDFKIDAVVTLDGALGGTPRFETAVAAEFGCWGKPAAQDLFHMWKSTHLHLAQGTSAIFGFGPRPRPSNGTLVSSARSLGTRVMTIGSRDDCVFNPGKCALPGVDNTSTQIVETADVPVMLDLGQNCQFSQENCILPSHAEAWQNGTVVSEVIKFIGAPMIP
jgi:hypothetical protein